MDPQTSMLAPTSPSYNTNSRRGRNRRRNRNRNRNQNARQDGDDSCRPQGCENTTTQNDIPAGPNTNTLNGNIRDGQNAITANDTPNDHHRPSRRNRGRRRRSRGGSSTKHNERTAENLNTGGREDGHGNNENQSSRPPRNHRPSHTNQHPPSTPRTPLQSGNTQTQPNGNNTSNRHTIPKFMEWVEFPPRASNRLRRGNSQDEDEDDEDDDFPPTPRADIPGSVHANDWLNDVHRDYCTGEVLGNRPPIEELYPRERIKLWFRSQEAYSEQNGDEAEDDATGVQEETLTDANPQQTLHPLMAPDASRPGIHGLVLSSAQYRKVPYVRRQLSEFELSTYAVCTRCKKSKYIPSYKTHLISSSVLTLDRMLLQHQARPKGASARVPGRGA